MTVTAKIIALVKEASPEELEEIRWYLHKIINGQCKRCGRALAVTHHLDYGNLPEGKVCMPCLGGS